jgi:hypothetical protein
MDRQAAWIVVYELRAGLFSRRSWPPRAPTACAAIGQPCRVANPAPIPPGVDPGSVRECRCCRWPAGRFRALTAFVTYDRCLDDY